MGKRENLLLQTHMTPNRAANRRHRHEHEEDDDHSLNSTQSNNGNSSRLGRKGDPRMHKAVAARLADPDLSLIDALRIGGFEYPSEVNDDNYILEKDTVSLGQRKNQLSRRCRLAKQQGGGSTRTARSRKSDNTMKQSSTDYSTSERRGQKRHLTLPEDDVDEEGGQQRMAKYHPQYHPIIVPPAAHVSLANVSQPQQADEASSAAWPAPASHSDLLMSVAGGAHQQTLLESLNHPNQTHHPSGVAVASLNATASSVGLTLEQLAVSLSSTTNLAKVLADQSIPEIKQDLALNLYSAECKTLYQRCMLLAGYNLEDTKGTSLAYKEFAYKAWSAEGKRLEKQVGRMDSLASSTESQTDSEKVSAANLDENQAAKKCCNGNTNGDCCNTNEKCCSGTPNDEKTCFDGRHVHRLEGKCGHKAIIHQPDNGPAHVDFVVDGKVECYEGIKPAGSNVAMWPSRYNCEELACPTDENAHKVRRWNA